MAAAQAGPVPALALGQQHGRRGGAVGRAVLGVHAVFVVDLKGARGLLRGELLWRGGDRGGPEGEEEGDEGGGLHFCGWFGGWCLD